MQPIAKQRALRAPSPGRVSSSFPAISSFPVCHRKASRRRRFALRICLGIALLAALGAPVAYAATAPASSASGESGDPFAAWIAEAARRFDIPASWIRDVMRIESRSDARAVSPKGAIGLMQLMPQTWADLRLRYGLGSDPFDPRDNILAGAAYLRELHDRFGDAGFLAAYNSGPARYEAFLTTGRPLPDETRAYLGTLAPLAAGGAAETRLAVASQVPSWAAAPLVVLLAARSSPAHGVSFAVQHERSSGVARVADLTGFVPQSNDLFIAISHQNSMP